MTRMNNRAELDKVYSSERAQGRGGASLKEPFEHVLDDASSFSMHLPIDIYSHFRILKEGVRRAMKFQDAGMKGSMRGFGYKNR